MVDCGFNIFASALFTALSNGKISAILSFLRTFCFITIGLLALPLILRENGVWLAVPIAEDPLSIGIFSLAKPEAVAGFIRLRSSGTI